MDKINGSPSTTEDRWTKMEGLILQNRLSCDKPSGGHKIVSHIRSLLHAKDDNLFRQVEKATA